MTYLFSNRDGAMKKRLLALGVTAAVFGFGYLWGASRTPAGPTGDSADFPLLANRLFVENPSDRRINFSRLRATLNEYFSNRNLRGSLYFEYLPTGTSVRVNPDERYQAASLIKLPVAMELFKAEELGLISLDQTIALKKEWLNDGFGELYKRGAGYELTLAEAAKILLVDSDNTALRAIIETNDNVLQLDDRALGSLDIEFSTGEDETISIGTRSYSSFLKCLYFACYNNKAHSQEILSYLTQTSFDNRLVAGVDEGVKVAHKIGVFNTQVQSDCGIVYLESNNYVLCIMLIGNDDQATNSTIADISRLVFDYVSNASLTDD